VGSGKILRLEAGATRAQNERSERNDPAKNWFYFSHEANNAQLRRKRDRHDDSLSSNGEVPNTFAEMAKNAEAFIDALRLTKVDVLGFSIGSMISSLSPWIGPTWFAGS
jgi:pimeloyl-ACP methyl ester carboxylesterase